MMNAKKTIPEKRKYPRFKSYNVIRVVGPGVREIQRESALVNMSEGGLLFYSAEEVKADTTIQIHIEIPDFHSSITVGAKVTWVQLAMEQANCYFVGAKFVDLREADKELIRQLRDKSGA